MKLHSPIDMNHEYSIYDKVSWHYSKYCIHDNVSYDIITNIVSMTSRFYMTKCHVALLQIYYISTMSFLFLLAANVLN